MFDNIFKSLTKTVDSLRSGVEDHANKVKSKRDELEFLRNSPPPKTDVTAYLESVVDRNADGYNQAFEFTLDLICKNPLGAAQLHGMSVITAAPPGEQPSFRSVEAAILALFRDDVKAALRRKIEAMPWPAKVGPAISDRPAMIAKCEQELATLEKDLAELRQQAAQAGILI